MTTENESSTPGGARGKAATAENHGDLAELLAAVMSHPDTPGEVVNAVADTLCGLRDRDGLADAEVIRRALANADAPGAAEDAGAVAQLLEARAASLTPAEVRALCEDLAYRHGGDEEDAADFLAVLTAAVYRRETGDREGLLLAARAGFMPVIEAASSAVDSLILKRLEVWRG
jgi:hypothetical protein